jgi:ribosome-interacting GTPase 1
VLDFTFNVTADPAKIDLILKEIRNMIIELEDLKTKVTELQSASEATVNLLGLIKTKLDEQVANAATLEELRQGVAEVALQIGQESQDLADAVVANTPAA